jgi:predicted metal-binding membrane protein
MSAAASRTESRVSVTLVALLLGVAALAWWTAAERMDGMDAAPGVELGTVGWFLGVWTLMMTAMMLPSVAPTTALYARMARRSEPTAAPLVFTAGYLLAWVAAGVVAYAAAALVDAMLDLQWAQGGRLLAGGILLLAAAYELTPAKDACLSRCRSPLAFLLTAWRAGLPGALRMGAWLGGWCLGCCWALMAALFALGAMNLAWMASFAVLIALEKLLPWGRAVRVAAAVALAALGVALLAAPDAVPWLMVPGEMGE